MPHAMRSGQIPGRERRLPVWAWIVLVVIYLVLLQGAGLVLTRGLAAQYAAPTSIDILWRSITVPVGLSLILVLASIGWLRWWRPVYVDDKPVRPWLIAIPVTMLVTILIVTNYSGLATRGIGFTLLLLLSMMFVGFAEEGMFRGIGLTALRRDGFTEGKAALWSTVAFALAHATNLLTEGTGAFAQVLATAVAGYFFYLIRRRTAGLLVPSIVHGLWDFSLISGAVVPGASNLLGVLSFLVMVILAVLLLVKRHDIEPAISPHAGSATKSVT